MKSSISRAAKRTVPDFQMGRTSASRMKTAVSASGWPGISRAWTASLSAARRTAAARSSFPVTGSTWAATKSQGPLPVKSAAPVRMRSTAASSGKPTRISNIWQATSIPWTRGSIGSVQVRPLWQRSIPRTSIPMTNGILPPGTAITKMPVPLLWELSTDRRKTCSFPWAAASAAVKKWSTPV